MEGLIVVKGNVDVVRNGILKGEVSVNIIIKEINGYVF